MDTPNINTIKAMPKDELATLNRQQTRRLAMHMVGLIFVKLAAPRVVGNILTKAIITAAKRAA